MAWLQLRVFTRTPEFAGELLDAFNAAAVSFVDAADTPILEPGPGATPYWPDTVTLGYFADDFDVAPVSSALREAMPEGDALVIETLWIEDQDWVRVWLDNWHPQRVAENLWVVPTEKRGEVPADGATVLVLDPGLAFGTGTHPSTALCLEWLAQADLKDKTVLDYGCGSGILAIAALLLGARHAVCVDYDPQALIASVNNAKTNGVADKLTVMLPQDFEPQAFDVVLANILANTLIELAPRLAQCSKPGGKLVMAGLLERHADEVCGAYNPWFTFGVDGQKDGWNRPVGTCTLPALIHYRRLSNDWATAGQPQPAHFAVLKKAGYAAVINLAMPTSAGFIADEGAIVQGLGMDYHYLGVPWNAPTAEHFAEFCQWMTQWDGQKVFIHCAANKRVSAFMYLYRMLVKGENAELALADMQAIWQPNEIWSEFIAQSLKR